MCSGTSVKHRQDRKADNGAVPRSRFATGRSDIRAIWGWWCEHPQCTRASGRREEAKDGPRSEGVGAGAGAGAQRRAGVTFTPIAPVE